MNSNSVVKCSLIKNANESKRVCKTVALSFRTYNRHIPSKCRAIRNVALRWNYLCYLVCTEIEIEIENIPWNKFTFCCRSRSLSLTLPLSLSLSMSLCVPLARSLVLSHLLLQFLFHSIFLLLLFCLGNKRKCACMYYKMRCNESKARARARLLCRSFIRLPVWSFVRSFVDLFVCSHKSKCYTAE